jgi:hypothetical protein
MVAINLWIHLCRFSSATSASRSNCRAHREEVGEANGPRTLTPDAKSVLPFSRLQELGGESGVESIRRRPFPAALDVCEKECSLCAEPAKRLESHQRGCFVGV